MLLELENMHVFYGRIEAIKGLSITVEEGEVVTLIGANGAGKTTTLKAISGIRPVAEGRILFDGQDITSVAAHRRVELGICQSPEGRRVFPGMSVLENLEMGAYALKDRTAKQRQQDLERVFTLFPRLKERATQVGGTLSGGEQQMLAIGRALMARPRLLLLDEPSLGLAPLVTRELFAQLGELNRTEGMTILVVEQNANLALDIGHRGYVLETGRIAVQGSAADLHDDEAVRRAYLGF